MVPIVMNPGARENAEFRPCVNIGFRERPAKNTKNAHFNTYLIIYCMSSIVLNTLFSTMFPLLQKYMVLPLSPLLQKYTVFDHAPLFKNHRNTHGFMSMVIQTPRKTHGFMNMAITTPRKTHGFINKNLIID